ncbi:Endonuclease/exonuclease/phosphatase [Schizothecium vesticola]|uniref:Endonuclease/exonuclease/phosphatase n=1 Tax=Schizothecium vesticola TaxID=314040 RepID=A0AA40JYV4_9PEZI|nr:Endonuclease/exonuclease/phosphatase [Schizothecium vesticola]
MRPSHLLPAAAALSHALLTIGHLPLLTINIAGLPALLQSNAIPGSKAANTAYLGTLLSASPYAVIHLQEDFNYHAALYSTTAASFPHRTPTSGGVPFGSGLNTLSRLPFHQLQRTKWSSCSSASGADCLTPKGFTFTRLMLASTGSEAAYLDLYNLHTDAGSLPADLAARQANMAQVLAHIDGWSAGNAVVVAGDTNSRYSREADAGLRGFLGAGFRDAWVEVERGGVVPGVGEESLCENPSGTGWCETVDKVLVRGGGVVGVGVEGFGDELWVEAEVCQGQKDGRTRIFYLRAGTSAGRSLATGTKTADCAVLVAPDGWQIAGFMGQHGDEVDQLALVYVPQ